MAAAIFAWSDLDCFALPPLTAYAVSGRVTVHPLDANSGCAGPAEVREYTAVDLDAWARACLADLDALSAEPFASITRQLAAAPSERLRCARDALADVIAAGLRPLRADADAGDVQTLGAARALLARRLRYRLADAYQIAAVVEVVDRLLLIDATTIDTGRDALADPGESQPLAQPHAPPFPLREIPGGPRLVEQSAHFAAGATSVEAALSYDCEWQFDDALLLNDRIDIRISLNTVAAAPSPPPPSQEECALLAVLAQHQASRSAVWEIVGVPGELDRASARDPGALGRALDGCTALAERLGEAWNDAGIRAAAQVPAVPAAASGIAYAITPVAAANAGPEASGALIVECTTTDGRCVWPRIDVSAGDGAPVALIAEAARGSTRVYRFTPDPDDIRIDAGKPLRVHLALPSLSLLDVASLSFAAGVTRNAHLFGRAAPPTHRAFVCHSPMATFGTPLQPSGDDDCPIDIGEWTGDLERNPLTRLLDAVFRAGSAITQFALSVSGASSLRAAEARADRVAAMHPLLCLPMASGEQRAPIMRQAIDDIGMAMAAASAGRLHSLVIDLTLYAGERPVLRLRRLQATLATARE